jgi:hypothetical protein
MASIEARRLQLLEPSTRDFAQGILVWARSQGIPAILGETHRTQEEQDRHIFEGRSAIKEGSFGWHQVGRAFHLIVRKGKGLDRDAYPILGAEVRRRGGEWLGDVPIRTKAGLVTDLAHFEFHPGITLSEYRKSPMAKKELALAEKRVARFG